MIISLLCKCCNPSSVYQSPVYLSCCRHIVCQEKIVYLNNSFICPLCDCANVTCVDDMVEIDFLKNRIHDCHSNCCKVHLQPFKYYCLQCNKLFCTLCNHDFMNHEFYDIQNHIFSFYSSQIKQYFIKNQDIFKFKLNKVLLELDINNSKLLDVIDIKDPILKNSIEKSLLQENNLLYNLKDKLEQILSISLNLDKEKQNIKQLLTLQSFFTIINIYQLNNINDDPEMNLFPITNSFRILSPPPIKVVGKINSEPLGQFLKSSNQPNTFTISGYHKTTRFYYFLYENSYFKYFKFIFEIRDLYKDLQSILSNFFSITTLETKDVVPTFNQRVKDIGPILIIYHSSIFQQFPTDLLNIKIIKLLNSLDMLIYFDNHYFCPKLTKSQCDQLLSSLINDSIHIPNSLMIEFRKMTEKKPREIIKIASKLNNGNSFLLKCNLDFFNRYKNNLNYQ